mgnify:CR=1 FL=1
MQSRPMLRLFAVLMASIVAVSPPPAEKNTLMGLLFRGRDKPAKERSVQQPRKQQKATKVYPKAPKANRTTEKRRAAPADADPQPTITGPEYYAYKASPVVAFDFSKLARDPQVSGEITGATGLPSLAMPSQFAEAARHFEGFKPVAEKDIAKAVLDHYSSSPKFLWVSGFGISQHAEAVLKLLGEADAWGLSAQDYAVAPPPAAWSMNDTAGRLADLARFDAMLTLRAVRYALDASNGIVDPNKISGYHDFPRRGLSVEEAVEKLAASDDPAAWLKAQHPQMPEFAALKDELAALGKQTDTVIPLPDKLLLKAGGESEHLAAIVAAVGRRGTAQLKEKHAEALTLGESASVYDEKLVALVRDFQKENGLSPDGVIGPRTLSKMTDLSVADRMTRVRHAMERLRWHPQVFGARHVLINQPAFTATYYEDDKPELSMRVVVGTKANQTYFFHDVIETVVYNPYWGVPQSIIVNEMLPKLRRDPSWLDRQGYEVVSASGKQVSSSSVNWWRVGKSVPYGVRQKPGSSNALGELKILFPNSHDIYMHDTPAKALFQRDERAFSHGCVRLHEPRRMAAALLKVPEAEIDARIAGGKNQQVVLNEKVPVYVAYFTAWPDVDGKIQYFTDIYDRDMYLERAVTATSQARNPQG